MKPGRAQSLVFVIALLFLLTLMVCLTLSLSRMTKRKMEAQVATDTAAYSQAVATARTYNAVALMNRAMAGQLVASLGVESAISYSGAWWSATCLTHRELLRCAFDTWGDYCDHEGGREIGGCGCDVIHELISGNGSSFKRLNDEWHRLNAGWDALDKAAGAQARTLNVYAKRFGGYNSQAMLDLRNKTIRSLALANKVATYSNSSLSLSSAPLKTNMRELDVATTEEEVEEGSLEVTTASRTHLFITRRDTGLQVFNEAFQRLFAGATSQAEVTRHEGVSYYDSTRSHNANASTPMAWGDEVTGRITVTMTPTKAKAPCISQMRCSFGAAYNFEGVVKSTDLQDEGDEHTWEPRECGTTAIRGDNAKERHTMPPRASVEAICPGGSCIWPLIWDMNPDELTNAGDRFGQPKLLVAAQAPLADGAMGATDPWNLMVRFRFQPSSAGTTLDLKSLKLKGGEDVSLQQAIATGMAYYHRPGHFREPPNLFNPFWRATLIHTDVDRTGRGDFRAAVQGSGPPHVTEALDALSTAGFSAIP